MKTVLITGAGSGFGEAAALGLAQQGCRVIATVQISPQVTQLRNKVAQMGLQHRVQVEKLDLQDPHDCRHALTWDVDVLWNNAGIGEAGPMGEIPVDLVRRNFETNVFLPLELTQGFVRKWVNEKRPGKVVFTSSVVGLFTPPGIGAYSATKHALEAVAESLQQELLPHGIRVQVINPGAFFTGYNERMVDTAFRWLDDTRNYTRSEEFRNALEARFSRPEGRLDPAEMIQRMIEVVPADAGKFREVCPAFMEDVVKQFQNEVWQRMI